MIEHKVHNHGFNEGERVPCREITLKDGRLLGECMLPFPLPTPPTLPNLVPDLGPAYGYDEQEKAYIKRFLAKL